MGQEALSRILADLSSLGIFEDACSNLPAGWTSAWFVPETGEEQWSPS